MTFQDKREAILDRVRKLQALAGSSNPHEADTAHKRAADLMEKWGISEGEARDEAMAAIGEHPVPGVDFADSWRFGLLTAVAMRYGCRTIRHFGPRPLWGDIIGPAENATLVEFVFRKLEGDVARLGARDIEVGLTRLKREIYEEAAPYLGEEKAVNRANSWSDTWKKRYADDVRESYCLGATMTLQDRILVLEEEIPLTYEDIKKAAEKQGETKVTETDVTSVAAASPETTETIRPTSGEAGPVKAVMESPVEKSDHHQDPTETADTVRRYMEKNQQQAEQFSGNIRVSDLRAYARGKKAGVRIAMPGTMVVTISVKQSGQPEPGQVEQSGNEKPISEKNLRSEPAPLHGG